MIKIHDKIWYVIKPEDEDNLAYMCQAELTKDGAYSSSTQKMQSTGRNWARINERHTYKQKVGGATWEWEYDESRRPIIESTIPAKQGEEFLVDNSPVDGFYIGESVSRWSTENKLFRVKDPRGFTVEVPTGNIAALLHHTTVVKGVVQGNCVWGREGNSHVLLPINSEPYLKTLDQMDTLQNKLISVKDLKIGDWVKMFEDDEEYYYAGKVRATWEIRGVTVHHNHWTGNKSSTEETAPVGVVDDKWERVFFYRYSGADKYHPITPAAPKIVEVLRNEKLELTIDNAILYCPVRVDNKSGLGGGRFYHLKRELVGLEFKEK